MQQLLSLGSARRPYIATRPAAVREKSTVYAVFAMLAFAVIYLQKLAVNFGGDGALGLGAVLMWGGVGWLLLKGELEVSMLRLVLFIALINSIALGLLVAGKWPNFLSLGILLAFYACLLFRVNVSRSFVDRCFRSYQFWMLFIALITIGQQVIQYTIGNKYWINLDHFIPKVFQYPGYQYIRPYEWRSPYNNPNAIFFLEPSALSEALAISVGLDFLWFSNMWRLGLFTGAMLACLAGSGPVSLILTGPLFLFKAGRNFLIGGLLVGVPLLIGLGASGAFDTQLARVNEINDSNKSGYARIVKPLMQIADEFERPGWIITGTGPGTTPKGFNIAAWPFSKLFHEYGFVMAVIFHLYLLACIFESPPSRVLSWLIVVPILFFGGGFVTHPVVMPLVMFCTLFRIVEDKKPAAREPMTLHYEPRPRSVTNLS